MTDEIFQMNIFLGYIDIFFSEEGHKAVVGEKNVFLFIWKI